MGARHGVADFHSARDHLPVSHESAAHLSPVPSSSTSPALLGAMLTTLAGGIVLLFAFAIELPIAVLAIGLLLFVAGTVLAIVLAYWDARRSGTTVLRAIGRTFRFAFKWLLMMLP